MMIRKYLITIFSLFLFFSCDDGIAGIETDVIIGTSEIIDATSYSEWVYFEFTDTTLFEVPNLGENIMQNSPVWDIAFQRYHMRTNSGFSGSSNGGAALYDDNHWTINSFNDIEIIPNNLEFVADSIVNTFYNQTTHQYYEGIANPILESWAEIDTMSNYTLTIYNNKFILRTADGEKYYKLWVYDYYDENGHSGNISIVYDKVYIETEYE